MPAPLPAGHIEVQHVLIGFAGSVPGKNITRTQDEAKTLAYDILARAKKGDDFGQLVQQNTDDQYPGIYRLADTGVQVEQGVEYPRDGMVKGFSDVAFSLKQGQVGIADYAKPGSPYGWHIIKRLR
jgi:parvulin-like peptidyl-prolyl isomerase